MEHVEQNRESQYEWEGQPSQPSIGPSANQLNLSSSKRFIGMSINDTDHLLAWFEDS